MFFFFNLATVQERENPEPSPPPPPLSSKERWENMRRHLLASWTRASIILLLFSYSNMANRSFGIVIWFFLFPFYSEVEKERPEKLK